MAKKAAVKEETTSEAPKFSFGQGGQGKKQCPECDAFVGARVVGKCPNPDCSHVFVAKVKSEKKQKDLFDPISPQNVAMFALRMGSISKAIVAVEALKADPVSDFAASCGGVGAALEALKALEAQMAIG